MSEQSPLGSPLGSFDHPILSSSISAREAIPEDATPRSFSNKYNRPSSGRPGHARSNSLETPLKETRDSPPSYFEAHDKRPGPQRRAHSGDLRSGMASPVMPVIPEDLSLKPTTEIRAGFVQKSFSIHTDLLVSESLYFAALQKPNVTSTTNTAQPSVRLSGPFFFPHLDEFAFALFVRWIYGGKLHGPSDFHSMNHYVCLYVLARDFQIESLKNKVMDLVRDYYRCEDMTSPAYRLDFIYTYTDGSCFMREFLVSTAAYRALAEGEEGGLTDSIKNTLRKGGDLAPDFAEALCKLYQNARQDVRKGDDCQWHEHTVTAKCEPALPLEPYETT